MTLYPSYCIEPVKLYDKSFENLVLYEKYLICIFMKINKNVKDEEKLGKTMSIARYCICYKTYLAFPGQSLKAVSVVRGTFVIHKILSSAKKHVHDVKLYSFHTAPHAILQDRMYLQKYYPTNRLL